MPDGVYEHFAGGIGARGAEARAGMDELFDAYRATISRNSRPKSSRCSAVNFPAGGTAISRFSRRSKRNGGKRCLRQSPERPRAEYTLVSRRLGRSWRPRTRHFLTFAGAGDFQADTPAGRNLHFGIREHAMVAIVNGLSLSKLRAFGATFFIFSDYARPAIRLSAMMELPTIFVFTHDAMGDGEDGPTHQPVEQLASMRAIPGLVTIAARRCQ